MSKELHSPQRCRMLNIRFEYQLAIIDPIFVFDNPSDVVKSTTLTRAQKIQILSIWEYDGRGAKGDVKIGTPPDRHNPLPDLHSALKVINDMLDLEHELLTKHRGAAASH